MSNRLTILWDALWWLVPFSLVGALFGDAIRKDVMTARQRVIVGAFCLMYGPLMGAVCIREWGWSEFSALAVAAVAPTIAYDVIGLVVAFLRQGRDDPRGWVTLLKDMVVAALNALLPWRKP
jgi:hypothetical protein